MKSSRLARTVRGGRGGNITTAYCHAISGINLLHQFVTCKHGPSLRSPLWAGSPDYKSQCYTNTNEPAAPQNGDVSLVLTNPYALMVAEYLAQALPQSLGHLRSGFFIFLQSEFDFSILSAHWEKPGTNISPWCYCLMFCLDCKKQKRRKKKSFPFKGKKKWKVEWGKANLKSVEVVKSRL